MASLKELAMSITFKDKASKGIDDVNKKLDTTKTKGNKVTKAFENMGKKMGDAGGKLKNVGGKMTKMFTVPLVGAATAGTKMALDLEHNLKKVSTLADQDILPADKLKKEVREISDATGVAQTEISESVYGALSAGVETADVMEFVRSGVDLTRAGFTDMETVIDATTTVLNAYGDDAFKVSEIHDIFVQTQDKGKISVDELGKSIGRVTPTASALGVNVDQLGASYAILTAKGQNANIATTNLNSMLGEMGKTGSKADKALREMSGKSFKQLTEDGESIGDVLGMLEESAAKSGESLSDMFGSTTAAAAANTLLSEGIDGFNKSLDDMDKSTGKTAKNAKTMEDGWFKIKKAMTTAKNALIDVGGMLAPYVEKAADKVTELVSKFNEMPQAQKDMIVKTLGIIAVAGPAIKILGTVLTVGDKLMAGIGRLIPIAGKLGGAIKLVVGVLGGPLTAVLAVAIAGGIALWKNWDTVKQKASAFGQKVANTWNTLKGVVGQKITGTVTAVTGWFTDRVNNAKGLWSSSKEWISQTTTGVIEATTSWFTTKVNDAKTLWGTAKTKIGERIKGTFEAVTGAFHTAVDAAREKWQDLKEFFSAPITGTVNIIRNAWDGAKSKVSEWTGPSAATGMNRIPYDGFIVETHKDEMILTAKASEQYRAMGGTKDGIYTRGISAQSGASNTTTTTNNSPNVVINVSGGSNPQATAQAVRREMDNYFKMLNYQGI